MNARSQQPSQVMSAPAIAIGGAEAVVAATLRWLKQQVQATAQLHGDTRKLQAGDVFLAYAVGNAQQKSDGRTWLAQAVAQQAGALLWDSEDGFVLAEQVAQAGVPNLAVPGLNKLAGEVASRWYGEPSAAMQVIGITGTNGKTSCSQWLAQALCALAQPCAVVGTLGTGFPQALQVTGFTTPDAPQLQRSLAALQAQGAQAVAMEVSSHGLDQGRVNGTQFHTAIFTNLTQDHLDYHGTMAAYAAAKARLFAWPSLQFAVVNRDDAFGRELLKQVPAGVQAFAYGIGGTEEVSARQNLLLAKDLGATANGTAFTVIGVVAGQRYQAELTTALIGAFNISNLLAVLGGLLAAGVTWQAAIAQLRTLRPVAGRMEVIETSQRQAPLAVVDYAHTPDALEKTLAALRPVAEARGGQVWCVFGCGGDRDAGKRPLMGGVAERLAEHVILTSDNPRSEDPQVILKQIAAGLQVPNAAKQIEDRAAAILYAMKHAQSQDVVLVAGKGHEATQEIQGKKRPFSDPEHVALALSARGVTA